MVRVATSVMENLYIPTVAIEIGDIHCTDFRIVEYEAYDSIIVRVIHLYKSHILRIEFTRLILCNSNS